MALQLCVVVCADVADTIAYIRGSTEYNADEGTTIVNRPQCPIQSSRWGRGVTDGSVPKKRAWCFWTSTARAGTRAFLDDLVSQLLVTYYLWDDATETQDQFMTRWKTASGWVSK